MPTTEVGTPAALAAGSNRVTASPVTGTWNGTQTLTAGDILVACVTAQATTSCAATAQTNAGTVGGWVKQLEVGAGTKALCAIWTRIATGGDGAPAFSSTLSGTGVMTCTLYELTQADAGTPVEASGTVSSTGNIAAVSVTTSTALAASGEFAIGVMCHERGTAATRTVTATGTGFSLDTNDGSISSVGHTGCIHNPTPSAGSTLTGGISVTGTTTSSADAGILATFDSAPSLRGSADTSTMADGPLSPKVKGTDSAAASPGASSTASLSSADTAQGKGAAYNFGGDWGKAVEAASVQQGGSSPSSADTVHATEGASLHAAVPGADSAHGLEGPLVRVSGTDSAHGAEGGSVHASLLSADTAHGTEGQTVRISGADSCHALEGASVHATLAAADTAHGAEGPLVRVALADSAHGTEGASVHASLAKGDTSHATEPSPVRVAPGALADSAHGTEGSSVHVTLSGSDTGHATEFGAVPGSPAGTDLVHGVEGSVVRATLSGADSGHAVEAGQRSGNPQSADSGHATEGASVHVTVPGADTAQGADSGLVSAERFSSADTAHATESGQRSGNPVSADAGTAAEGSGVGGQVPAADAGHAVEAPRVQGLVPGADAVRGAEAASVHATLSGADVAAAAEHGQSSGGITDVSSADHGLATESAFYYFASGDAASAAEGAVPVIKVAGKDTGRPADAPQNAWPAAKDAAKAADRPASAWPAGDDTGRAGEAVKPFRFALSDFGHGLEVLHEMGIWTYVPVNVRLEGRFWRITGTDEDGNEVTVLEGERITGQVLKLAEVISFSRSVRKVCSADSAAACEALARVPVAVSCWVLPEITVSVSVAEVPATVLV